VSRHIEIDVFDPGSINAAIAQLDDYARWIQVKADELRERLGDMIRDKAQPVFNASVADNVFRVIDGSFVDETEFGKVEVYVISSQDLTVVFADGEDAVFMEFGAGVYYNGAAGSSPNPLGANLGFTIGSYGPNGAKETWGYYGEDGELHLTHGTPASMPLYKAVQSVRQDLVQIAKEVFGS
jgi:hypothetical protein